jgi:hypothetical protein
MTSGVPEQLRLSDAGLASDDQDGALTLAHVCEEPVEQCALAGPVEKPGRKADGHLPGNANRCGIHKIVTNQSTNTGELHRCGC